MAASVIEEDRGLIPRWRDSRRYHRSEGDSRAPSPVKDLFDPASFAELLRRWADEPSVLSASELVGAALVNGRIAQAEAPAKYLLRELRPSLQRLARRALGLDCGQEDSLDYTPAASARTRIGKLKARVREDPRNTLAWTDLSREYAVLGQTSHALRAMETATVLSPQHRHVLRAAAALHVHAGDAEHGVWLLRKADSTKRDPWLMAAELAVSRAAGCAPKSAKAGRRLVESGALLPADISELAAALATEELRSGAERNARKLFEVALIAPTDNTVAQAEWARRAIPRIPLERRHLEAPQSYEARAREHRVKGSWREAVEECWRWLYDQPFSPEPAVHGSYIASTALSNQKESERIARAGLVANPDNDILLNNLAVSLALQGNTGAARATFQRIGRSTADVAHKATLLATDGLIAFREHRPEHGRAQYLAAFTLLTGPRLLRTRAHAALYLAREEVLLGEPSGRDVLQAACALAEKTAAPETKVLAAAVRSFAASRGVVL